MKNRKGEWEFRLDLVPDNPEELERLYQEYRNARDNLIAFLRDSTLEPVLRNEAPSSD